jgi:hypothetical protein
MPVRAFSLTTDTFARRYLHCKLRLHAPIVNWRKIAFSPTMPISWLLVKLPVYNSYAFVLRVINPERLMVRNNADHRIKANIDQTDLLYQVDC